MLFNSFDFIFYFLPALLMLYVVAEKFSFLKRYLQLVFLTFSYFFIGYWSTDALILIICSTLFNYNISKALIKTTNKDVLHKNILRFAVSVNLFVIGYFKYANFSINTVNTLFSHNFVRLDIVLPIGISFYTFQQVAYIVDVYKEKAAPKGLINYALFVAFFPQLIAGPIVLFKDLQSQLLKLKDVNPKWNNIAWAITYFSIGLFSKVVIADSLIPYVKPVFSNAEYGMSLGFFEAWTGVIAYTFQLYFDFSGYTTMAVGLGLLFGIKLPWNFNSPYQSTSIIDFWRRWHITLSHFLRDYLYIPLGGNRKGVIRKDVNLMITMLLGGLWHGAGWNFVIWGGLHGSYLIINHYFREKIKIKIPKLLAFFVTFLCVIHAWVFFRALTLDGAMSIFKGMYNFSSINFALISKGAILKIGVAAIIAFSFPATSRLRENSLENDTGIFSKPGYLWLMLIIFNLSIAFLGMVIGSETEFLYFQF